MARRSAVRDHWALAGERLEAGDAARGVDEHVRRGQQVAHRVGEAEHPHARLVGERHSRAERAFLIASCEADDGRIELERSGNRARKVAHAPAAPGDHDELPVDRQAE